MSEKNLTVKQTSNRITHDSCYGTVMSKDVVNIAQFLTLKLSRTEGKFNFEPNPLMISDHILWPDITRYLFTGQECFLKGSCKQSYNDS